VSLPLYNKVLHPQLHLLLVPQLRQLHLLLPVQLAASTQQPSRTLGPNFRAALVLAVQPHLRRGSQMELLVLHRERFLPQFGFQMLLLLQLRVPLRLIPLLVAGLKTRLVGGLKFRLRPGGLRLLMGLPVPFHLSRVIQFYRGPSPFLRFLLVLRLLMGLPVPFHLSRVIQFYRGPSPFLRFLLGLRLLAPLPQNLPQMATLFLLELYL
jgi:hypothetical protein